MTRGVVRGVHYDAPQMLAYLDRIQYATVLQFSKEFSFEMFNVWCRCLIVHTCWAADYGTACTCLVVYCHVDVRVELRITSTHTTSLDDDHTIVVVVVVVAMENTNDKAAQ